MPNPNLKNRVVPNSAVDKTGKERSSNVNYYDFYKKEN